MTKKKAISITMPWSLYNDLKELSDKDGTSINQWICIAVAKEIVRREQKEVAHD